jgi:hypothetical protein
MRLSPATAPNYRKLDPKLAKALTSSVFPVRRALWKEEEVREYSLWEASTELHFGLLATDNLLYYIGAVTTAQLAAASLALEMPPLSAVFLFYLFMTPQNCDALVGDLEERYKIICKKFGTRKADFWYWVQVITSVGPIVWAATKKLLKAVSGVAALVEMWRRSRS